MQRTWISAMVVTEHGFLWQSELNITTPVFSGTWQCRVNSWTRS